MTLAETINYLNKKSGVSGLSGVSSDFRDLRNAAAEGNHRAQLALDVFTYSCRKYLGAYVAALGGVDCVVFTAGIGEHDEGVRKSIVTEMEYMGICLDENKNNNLGDGICDITADGGKVKILVIPTNEELVIARDTERIAK
jgi:acetate kinase